MRGVLTYILVISMTDIVFKDCEYRFTENDELYCKNKEAPDNGCDNCKGNVHLNCQNYVPRKDMCLQFFQSGISEVSQYDTCAEKVVFNDKELQRKWSN